MNELITKLAKPHFCSTEFNNGSMHQCYEFSKDELYTFVKSLFDEFESNIKKQHRVYTGYSIYDGGYEDGLKKSVKIAKETFGVV
jgi:hypothetical protein